MNPKIECETYKVTANAIGVKARDRKMICPPLGHESCKTLSENYENKRLNCYKKK